MTCTRSIYTWERKYFSEEIRDGIIFSITKCGIFKKTQLYVLMYFISNLTYTHYFQVKAMCRHFYSMKTKNKQTLVIKYKTNLFEPGVKLSGKMHARQLMPDSASPWVGVLGLTQNKPTLFSHNQYTNFPKIRVQTDPKPLDFSNPTMYQITC